MSALEVELPTEDQLLAELKTVRRRGITKLAGLELPALEQIVRAAGRVGIDEPVGAYAIEAMLRDVVVQIGGDDGDIAALILGLEPGGRSARPTDLRREGAERKRIGVEQFRHATEPDLLSQSTQLLLREAHTYRLRLSRLRDEKRTPLGSRLAVEWLSRFEAMYSIWTPISGVGNDLTAYRSTLLEEDRPWDRAPDPNDANDDAHTQERQAVGYVTDAFFHFTNMLYEERQFRIKFGGLWLLPESQAETDLRDALHRIELASPNNERDDSYLRILLSNAGGELHTFLSAVASDRIAKALHDEWQAWAATCNCTWSVGEQRGREMFPTHRNHPDISDQCDMHILIAACNDFCLILDDAWDQVADWYREVPTVHRRSLTAESVHLARDVRVFRHLGAGGAV